MNTQVEFYQHMGTDKWGWVLRVSNGQEAARSAKGYSSASAARKAWRTTVAKLRADEIEERTLPTVGR